jgi:uncharacterized peroxidase-related enzyme
MPWINQIYEDKAKGDLKKIYDKIKRERGKISNVMRIHSLNPGTMEKHLDLYLSIMFKKTNLSREEKELIAVVVSSVNECDYCIKHHSQALSHYWKDEIKLKKLLKDFKTIDLSDKTQTMLKYVYQLTKQPHKINRKDIDNLKKSGYLDEDILNINLIVSYFNFVNRIVLGLGVEYSDNEIKGYNY